MRAEPIHGVTPLRGSVFVDNLMIASADRLLHTRYADLGDLTQLRDHGLAGALIGHDVFNLAQLVEALVCHEMLYVNAEYLGIWNSGVERTAVEPLKDVVRPVCWPKDEILEAERALAQSFDSFPLSVGSIELGQLVGAASHCHGIMGISDRERDLFLPKNEQYGWGTPFNILVGAAFYLMCSQALGVPYKPSLLRGQLLASFLKREWGTRRVSASELALELVERSRAEVAEKYFERLIEFNLVELNVPCILAAVLREARSPNDVMTLAMQIRNTAEAAAFRQWSRDFAEVVQNGDLAQLGRFLRDIRVVVRDVNASLGLADDSGIELTIGWGPASASRMFALPAILKRPVYLKRHLWFLHKVYKGSMTLARISDQVRRVLLSDMPDCLSAEAFAGGNWPKRPS